MARTPLNPFSDASDPLKELEALTRRPWQEGQVVARRFRLGGLIGEGGMGSVYRATDIKQGEPVALKLLRGFSSTDIERFTRESKVLERLSHPGIVRYIDHGTGRDGMRYLAMAWLQGRTLGERLAEKGPLSVDESLVLVRRVADALASTHRLKLVHRDLKPDNLFLPADDLNRVTILDFGIVRTPTAADRVTVTGVALGSPGYMSPEQIRGDRVIDARSDIFSLGCVWFRCLTGRAPYEGSSAVAVVMKTVLGDAPRVREIEPSVPEWLDQLLARMMDKEPEGRPADGAELRDLLDRRCRPVLPTQKLTGPRALTEREQRVVSVILTSLTDPTAPQQPASDAEVERVMGGISDCVAPYDARLINMLEGGLVVLMRGSGTPAEQALRAAGCALDLQQLLGARAMALATGWGEVEGQKPLGSVIDRLSELAAEAPRTEVYVDRVTAGLLEREFVIERQGASCILVSRRGRAQTLRSILGQATPFVGRAGEMDELNAIYQKVLQLSMPQLVLVEGDAGIGKSRLFREFALSFADLTGILCIAVRCEPLQARDAFSVTGQLIRGVAGIGPDDPPAVQRNKLRSTAANDLPGLTLDRINSFLCEIAGIPLSAVSAEVKAARLDPILMQTQAQAAWRVWLWALCQRRPVVLLVDDLHWADRPSLNLLQSTVESLPGSRLLVAGFVRPQSEHDAWWGAATPHRITIGPLSSKESRQLVESTLGPLVEPTRVQTIVERAEGNVFFLEELIRAIGDNQLDRLPQTVLGMVQARLDGLSSDVRRTLRAASIFGNSSTVPGVAALIGGEQYQDRVSEHFTDLVEQQILLPDGAHRSATHRHYRFCSNLVRETAYATLTDSDRTLGHQLAADWLSQEQGESHPLVLAEHLARGKREREAGEFYARSAEHALDGNDFMGAIELCERALSCGLPPAEQCVVLGVEASASRYAGRLEAACAAFERMFALAQQGSPNWYEAIRGLLITAQHLKRHGVLEGALERLQNQPVDLTSVSGAQLRAYLTMAHVLQDLGRSERAAEFMDQARLVDDNLTTPAPLARAHLKRAQSFRSLLEGELQLAMEQSRDAVAGFELGGDPRSACAARVDFGSILNSLGQFERAGFISEQNISRCMELGLDEIADYSRANRGLSLARVQEFDEARRVLELALFRIRQSGVAELQATVRWYLSEVERLYGDLRAAHDHVFEAVRLSEESGNVLPTVLAQAARIQLAAGERAAARHLIERAMEHYNAVQMLEEGEILLFLVYAQTMLKVGARERAIEVLVESRQSLLARAGRIEDAVLRQSYLSAVPENSTLLALAFELAGPVSG